MSDFSDGLGKYEPMEGGQADFHRSKARIRVLSGGIGCLGEEEEILDPVLGKLRRISEIDSAFHVLAMNPVSGIISAASACCPFVKARGDIFLVKLSDGTSFASASYHRILDVTGHWITVFEALQTGRGILCVPDDTATARIKGDHTRIRMSSHVSRADPAPPDSILPPDDDFSATHPSSFNIAKYSGQRYVASMQLIRSRSEIWDFTVENGLGNYVHCGGIHAQSGKSVAGCWEGTIESLYGYRKGSLPTHGWVCREHFAKNPYTDPIFSRYWFGDEKFAPFIPRELQRKLSGNPKSVMELTNGSTITLRTWKQGWRSLQGEMPDWIQVDDQCDDEFFRELRRRMFRKANGWIIVTATDTAAQSWMGELRDEAERGNPDVQWFTVDTEQNIHADQTQIAVMSADMDELDREVYIRGGLKRVKGAVYRCWSDANWRDESELPDDGTDWVMIDPGIEHCAALWIRVTRPERRQSGIGLWSMMSDLWLVAEHYLRGEPDISRHVREIWGINREIRSRPAGYFIDAHQANKRKVSAGGRVYTELEIWKQAGLPVRPSITGKQETMRYRRFRATENYVRHDRQFHPNLYAVRTLKHLRRELTDYCVYGLIAPKGSEESITRKLEFRGPNHLIWGMETGVTMHLRYIPEQTAETSRLTPDELIGHMAWARIGTGKQLFTSGEISSINVARSVR